ncbi:MAG: hypothetical protein LBB77_12265, partial [Treponema sp.]|nr:hypothetical protein [Treponema sp.]
MVFRIFRSGKKKTALLGLLMTGFAVSGGLYGLGEKTLVLGAASGWDQVERRIRVTEVPRIRTNPVLALLPLRSGQERPGIAAGEGPLPDMAISFDEGERGLFADRTGNYRVMAGPS